MSGDIDQIWQNTVAAALLGTERKPFTAPAAPGNLGNALTGIQSNSPEKTLLASAATLALYRRAGAKPLTGKMELPLPAEAEERPVCSVNSGQHLKLMLQGDMRDVLPEWLEAAGKAGKRVPEEQIPTLLKQAGNNVALREQLAPVLGKRGYWLAARNPAWKFMTTAGDDTTWETGTFESRKAFLRQLRATDPARARDLLISTWKEERPEHRAAFLQTFGDGLSLEDEPFLEERLDERRKEVREAAQELLQALPGSRLIQRMEARLSNYLTLSESKNPLKVIGIKGNPTLVVTLPDEKEPGLERDGLDTQQTARTKKGARAFLLEQMLAIVPPSTWVTRWNLPPGKLIELALQTDFKENLLDGWTAAATRHRDPDWAEALLVYYRENNKPVNDDSLLLVLPVARREALVKGWIEKYEDALSYDWSEMVLACSRPLNPEISRLVIERVKQSINNSKGKYDYYLQNIMQQMALVISPSLDPKLVEDWPQNAQPYAQRAIDSFLNILHFRQEMLRELQRA